MQRPQLRGLSDGRVDVLGSARGSGRRSHGAGSNGHGGAAAIVKEESLEEEEKKCVAGVGVEEEQSQLRFSSVLLMECIERRRIGGTWML